MCNRCESLIYSVGYVKLLRFVGFFGEVSVGLTVSSLVVLSVDDVVVDEVLQLTNVNIKTLANIDNFFITKYFKTQKYDCFTNVFSSKSVPDTKRLVIQLLKQYRLHL